ncbi:hypothetical protein O2W15_12675 [Modestobacter sp. VKM Ac-2979]|uniref:hypothetical protein n=1 Tax=unclassified Modestobacter TaxID=2643866 RepID=UPI0022ABA237|nr:MULTISPECIES: hypothetical protein [unclassified Modestobacter]MCZ2812288.1 hypothetical protein [Modestobacter sp. VKM Ac-2979]MCZ2841178.1 hypothetical protein [Modestobacter sp. VKM Ac-2980]
MARAPRTPTGGALAALGLVALSAWVVFIVIELATVPEPGAPTVDALATQTASSLTQGNAEALQALLVDDAPADYAEQLLAGVPATEGDLEAVVRDSGRGDVIVVRAPAGGDSCLAWQVVPEDDRYLLGVVPPVNGC